MLKFLVFTFMVSWSHFSFADDLSVVEKNDIDTRLQRFYGNPSDTKIMNERVLKYSLKEKAARPLKGRLTRSENTFLENSDNPLIQNAGLKSTKLFREASCKQTHFSKSPCQSRAYQDFATSSEIGADKFENLTNTWMNEKKLVYDLNKIPSNAAVEVHPWSDDYWRLVWGGISYRISSEKEFETYEEAIANYEQPRDWENAKSDVAEALKSWSPAEKYDIAVGDLAFSLTNEQKNEGKNEIDEDGKVPDWVGLCDGWASAGIMTPAPKKAVDVIGADNVKVHMTPSDIRALTTLAWARGGYESNMLGSRCEEENPETYSNGRIKNENCFSINPSAFHMALGNMIGIAKKSFIMDASFDAEVWNQPLVSYTFTYFNPLDPSKRSSDWKEVAVDYDKKFKAKDRFQKPLTRGKHRSKNGRWNDKKIEKIVGVIASVTYVDEASPVSEDAPPYEMDARVNYIYDLELSTEDGVLVATGGEWQNNTHPDFFWVPTASTVASGKDDTIAHSYKVDKAPSAAVSASAAKLSKNGVPLCSVVSKIMNASAESGEYPKCPF